MNSLGYESLNVKSVEELKRIDKPEYSIEFLSGGIGSGKTFLMDEFYRNNKKVLYIKSHLSNREERVDAIINKGDLINILNSVTERNILIYEHNKTIKLDDIKDMLINFAKEKDYTILIDIDKLTDYEFFKNLENVNIIISVQNKNKIDKNLYKLPVFITEVDYRTITKLNKNYSGNISLRIPKSLHSDLYEESQNEGISLNQYLLYILASR